MNRFTHLFTHDWSEWEYYVERCVPTLLWFTLSEVTYKKRKCKFCGKEEDVFVGSGDCRKLKTEF